MGEIIDKITIRGFKSLKSLEGLELRNINVLIGSNGAGKSNFVGFFRLLRELIEQKLQLSLATQGGAEVCLFLGPRETKMLEVQLLFGQNGYEFSLAPTADNRLTFSNESTLYFGHLTSGKISRTSFGSGHFEARLSERRDDPGYSSSRRVSYYVFDAISSWVVYHFHDTSGVAGVRRPGGTNDNEILRPNADNLAAYLFRIQKTHPESYSKIRDVVRLAAPFFDDFKLRPMPATPDLIQLEWKQQGSDYPFLASQLSDGTLRFICLATALLQPDRPKTVLFDEPELGLHPYALSLLGGLVQKAVAPYGYLTDQVIISTQSALLLNEFVPEDVIVVERSDAQSTFHRLDSGQLSDWLADYTLGELWQKNLLGGRPHMESSNQALLNEELHP
jgi:predicted ATPase